MSLTSDALVVLPKPKHTLLPLLVVLFLVSYGLMALLVVEQGRTIDSQRNLIRQLFSDSAELTALKGATTQKHRAEAQAQAQASAHTQAQTPMSKSAPQDKTKAKQHSGSKVERPLPPRPSQDASDLADERRSLVSI